MERVEIKPNEVIEYDKRTRKISGVRRGFIVKQGPSKTEYYFLRTDRSVSLLIEPMGPNIPRVPVAVGKNGVSIINNENVHVLTYEPLTYSKK